MDVLDKVRMCKGKEFLLYEVDDILTDLEIDFRKVFVGELMRRDYINEFHREKFAC